MANAEIILGTTNPSKQQRLEHLLADFPVQLVGLAAVHNGLNEPAETAANPDDVAMAKATNYAMQLRDESLLAGRWVLAMDDMATLADVTNEEHAPGSFKDPVERTHGVFNPTTALRYYGRLAKKYNSSIPVQCRYGLALAGYPDEKGPIKVLSTTADLSYRMVAKPAKGVPIPTGYPLSSLLRLELSDGQEYARSELTPDQVREADAPLVRGIRGLLLHAGVVSLDFKGALS
jgi:hypothetical protein